MSSLPEPTSTRKKTRRIFAAAVFFLFAILIWFATWSPGGAIDLFEFGNWLGPASDMLAGKVPFRDTFPVHGFLSDGGMDLMVFSIFGAKLSNSVSAHQLVAVFLQPLLFLLAAAVTRRPAFALFTIPLHVGVSTAVAFDRPVIPIASLVFFVLALDQKALRSQAFLAGSLGALGLLYSLDFGTFVLAAEIATLIVAALASRRAEAKAIQMVSYLVGVGLVLVPFCLWLVLHGALHDFLRVSFVDLPRHAHEVWGLDFPTPWALVSEWLKGRPFMVGAIPVGPSIAKRFYLAALFGVVGVTVVVFLWRKRDRYVALRVLAVSVASLLFFRHVIARYHLAAGNSLAGPALFGALALLFDDPRWPQRKRFGLLAAAVVLVALAMNGPKRTLDIARNVLAYPDRLQLKSGLVRLSDSPRGDVLVPPDQAATVKALDRLVRVNTDPGSPIFDLTNRPALYFLLERTNPTRFYQAPTMAPFQEEVIHDLMRRPPSAVLLTSGTWLDAIDGRPNAERIPRILAYVSWAYPRRLKIAGTTVAFPSITERPGASGPSTHRQHGPNGATPQSDSLTLR